jgi:hypothetical protein
MPMSNSKTQDDLESLKTSVESEAEDNLKVGAAKMKYLSSFRYQKVKHDLGTSSKSSPSCD